MKTLAKRSLAIILVVFMLFSVMVAGITSASAETVFTNDVIYLQTNSQWRSLVDGGTDSEGEPIYVTARFAAYFYNESEETSAWVSAEAMENDAITYTVAVPEGNWTNVIFCRMNPEYEENIWNDDKVSDRVWNQTDNLTLSNKYDCFDITDWSMGKWTNYASKFVYFVNTKGWQEVASYCRSTTSYGGDIWPGKLCTLVDEKLDVYACKPGSYPLVMFNNYQYTGENTTTFDFNEVAGKYIEPKTNMAYDSAEAAWEAADNYVETTAPTSSTDSTEEPIEFSLTRIFFDNSNTQWKSVYLYGWSNGLDGTYLMTQIEDTDFWYYDLPQAATVGVTSFLFKNARAGWEGVYYTENVTIVEGCDCYKPEDNHYNDNGQLISPYTWTVYTGEAPELPTNPSESIDPGVPMYFPACDLSWQTLFTGLDSLGIDASYENRDRIANANGIADYTGTADQNNLMLSLLKSGMLRNPDYVEPATTVPVPKEFTLVGNINGVNKGCEDDHTSNPYIFDEKGELTVTFDKISYIYVKTTDQLNWYMFSNYTTEKTGTLYLSSHTTMEKMGVPAGTHKFKLVENSDGSLSISYETLSAPATNSSEESVTPVECREFYLVTNNTWNRDGARFAVYFYNYSGESIWVNLVSTNDENVYKTEIPEGNWSHIICARMNPAYMENDWNNNTVTDRIWNQTSDMSLNKSLNTLTLKSNEFSGEWSYTQETIKPTTPEPTESVPETTVPNLKKRYSLIGFINGKDAGINEDSVNVPYKFDKKGSLIITITEDSYVMVKTTNNEEWYGFEKYCTSTKGTLVLKGAEKMYVPAGSYVFTLAENADGKLALSYNPVTVIPTNPNNDPTDSDKTAKLTVKKNIKAGKTAIAKVENAGNNKVTFKTANKDIIKIDKKSGKIIALKKGTATIKAKVGGVTLTKKIKVTNDPKVQYGKGTLSNKAKITVAKGKKITLAVTGKASSINNKVVLKNKNLGKITSKANQEKIIIKTKKAGTSKLTVTINESKKYTFTIKVR